MQKWAFTSGRGRGGEAEEILAGGTSWEQREETWGRSGMVRGPSGSGHVCAPLLPGCGCVTRGVWGRPLRPEGTPRFPFSPPERRGPIGVSTERAYWDWLAPRGAGRKLGKRGCVRRGVPGEHPSGGGFCGQRRVFIFYLLHPIYFTDVGWPPNFISNLRGARRAEGREWKFSQSPGTSEGIAGGTRAALGWRGGVSMGRPIPQPSGGREGSDPLCCPQHQKRGHPGNPRAPHFPSLF